MGSSSWELGGFETCAAGDDQIWGCGQSCAISLPQMTRSVHCSASGPWHARRGVAFRGCERAALQLQPIEEGLQPGNVPFRRYARGRPGGIHLKFQIQSTTPTACPPPPLTAAGTAHSQLELVSCIRLSLPSCAPVISTTDSHAENTSPDLSSMPNPNPPKLANPPTDATRIPESQSFLPSPLAASGDSTSRSRWIRDRKGRNQAAEVAGAQNRNQNQGSSPENSPVQPEVVDDAQMRCGRDPTSQQMWLGPAILVAVRMTLQ